MGLAVGFGTAQADPLPGAIHCAGSYGGHLQGIAADDAALYWSFTVSLVKTGLDGMLLRHIDVPSHHGDLCVHEGKVFVAVNLGKFNEEPGQADSWIYVYNAADLSFVEKHAVPEVVHGAGGMDKAAGHYYVVGGLPSGHTQNYVYEYDAAFGFVRRHLLESGHTHLGIQTAFHTGAGWWFGCYGVPAVSLQTDETFGQVTRRTVDLSLGICRHPDGSLLRGVGEHVPGKKLWTGRMERVELPGPAAAAE
jgi:hypothetical protein